MSPKTMEGNEQTEPTAARESQVGPLAGIFTLMTAGCGVGLYVVSQGMAPALEAMGVDPMWLDAGLFFAGITTVWAAITTKGHAPEDEPVTAES